MSFANSKGTRSKPFALDDQLTKANYAYDVRRDELLMGHEKRHRRPSRKKAAGRVPGRLVQFVIASSRGADGRFAALDSEA